MEFTNLGFTQQDFDISVCLSTVGFLLGFFFFFSDCHMGQVTWRCGCNTLSLVIVSRQFGADK